MPSVDTKYFGTMDYREESVYDFPAGLPAFVDHRRFVLIELPQHAPLVFLQSLLTPELCFLAFPILVVDRDYHLGIAAEDLRALELNPDRQPELGTEAMLLALLSLHADSVPTANLLAPVVINIQNRRGLQAIRHDSLYSHQHPFELRTAEQSC